MHPFRFGITAYGAPSAEAWTSLARRAEALGYDVFLVIDHLNRQLSPITAMATAAAVTERIRIGSYVFANDFRHPLILAREMATLDFLSGGRAEVGLGAGWMPTDYAKLGLPYEAPGRRIDRLAEALPLFGRLLAGETVDHAGPTFTLAGASVHPAPVQRPRIPIMVGGGGPRMLRLAARHADIIAIQPQVSAAGRPMLRQALDRETSRKVAIIREAAGARFDSLELNIFVADAALAGRGVGLGRNVATIAKSLPVRLVGTPYVLYGTVASLRDELERRRERLGISYYGLPARALESMAPLVEALAGR